MSEIDEFVKELEEDVSSFEEALEEAYKPTSAGVDFHDGTLNIRLNFCGFESFEAAKDRTVEVVEDLSNNDAVSVKYFDVDAKGMYNPAAEEHDDRPAGSITAEAEV